MILSKRILQGSSPCLPANVEAQNQSKDFDIQLVHNDGYGITIYKVTTPKGSVYIARCGQGLCKLL